MLNLKTIGNPEPLNAFRKQMYMKYMEAIYKGAKTKDEACKIAGVRSRTIKNIQKQLNLSSPWSFNKKKTNDQKEKEKEGKKVKDKEK